MSSDRPNRIGVRLEPAIQDKLTKFAAQRGLKTATMASVIIGDWIVMQERQMAALKLTSKNQGDALQEVMRSVFNDPEQLKMLMENTPDLLIQQPEK